MRRVVTFTAMPCGNAVSQLFRAEYEEGTLPDGTPYTRLVPGTLVQLTSVGLVESDRRRTTMEGITDDASTK